VLKVTDSIRAPHRPRTIGKGFSFTEILFAVMILGIGFIMVAAIFPVAIKQTKISQEESIGSAIVRSAVGTVTQIAPLQFLPPNTYPQTPLSVLRPTTQLLGYNDIADFYAATLNPSNIVAIGNRYQTPSSISITSQTIPGQVWPLGFDASALDSVAQVGSTIYNPAQPLASPFLPITPNVVWSMVSQNMIQAIDSRYAWVGFYKRDLIETGLPLSAGTTHFSFAPTLQLIVVAVRATTKTNFEASDVVAGSTPNTLQPIVGNVKFVPADATHFATTVQFDPSSGARAVEGAFVIIADDFLPTTSTVHGALNGHFYRLGTDVSNVGNPPNTWELAPGYGLSNSDLAFMANFKTTFQIWIIGKAQDPNNSNQYGGLAQDIAIYSTFISCGTN